MLYADVLVALAEAQVAGDEAALVRARRGVVGRLGSEGLVDAAAVVANFERMVRIADSTGIPLDAPVNAMTGDIRGDLGLGRFASASNTAEASWLARAGAPVAIRVAGQPEARIRGALSTESAIDAPPSI